MFNSVDVDRLKKRLEKVKNTSAFFMKEIDNTMQKLPQKQEERGAFEKKINDTSINNSRSSQERST